MPVEIRVHKNYSGRVDRARLKRAARRALNAEANRGGVSIYIATDREIRALNKKFHSTDAATDVLSFPALNSGRAFMPALHGHNRPATFYLGDIIISYDRARIQAREAHWRIADELELLVVHGVLHLLGYDDVTSRKKKKMWQRQGEILGKRLERVCKKGK